MRKTEEDKDSQDIDEGISIFDYVEDDANIDKMGNKHSNDNEKMGNETAETSTDDKLNNENEIRSEEIKKSQQKNFKNKKR